MARNLDVKYQFDLIIPVPMHKIRLLRRLYNQAELLAIYIGKLTNLKVDPRILIRTKNTISQTGLSYKKRQANISKAFIVNEKLKSKLIGKKILLIDDVITSGATINRCAEVLLKAGASKVEVLALAKTIL